MTGIFRKISDYDRLAQELDETKKKLAQAEEELERLRSELGRLKGQLDGALEKAREERRRRAEEESRRGRAEKELGEKAKELEKLSRMLAEMEAKGFGPEEVAVLEREAHLTPEKISSFVAGIELGPAEECQSVLVPATGCVAFLQGIRGMASWAARLSRGGKGLVGFVSGRKACILEPPLPVDREERRTGEAFDLSLLEGLTNRPLVAFVSVHRDAYAVCLLDGRLRGSVFEGKDVLGRSKKGGFSQARFARFREDQVKHLLLEADRAASEILGNASPACLLLEGDDRTLSAFMEISSTVKRHRTIRCTLPGKLTRKLLEKLPEIVWKWKAWVFDIPPVALQPKG